MPRPEPEPQAIALIPGDHVQVQVRDGLAHHVVDKDHRSVGAQAVFDRALEPLRRGEELGYLLGRQLAEQPHMLLRREQRVPAEQRPVIEERDQPLRLPDDHGRRLTPDDGTEGTAGRHQPRAYRRARSRPSFPERTSPISLHHWLRVVFWPLAVIRSPCCVMLMLWIFTPAGSF